VSEGQAPVEDQDEPEAENGKKGKKGKKEKQGKKGKGDSADGLTIVGHPRAGAHVRLAKGWGGMVAFLVTAYLSLSAGVTPDQAGLRAIAAGVGGYILGWACSVTVWRHLLLAELRALAEHANGTPAAPTRPPLASAPEPAEAQAKADE
jgi:hypothetical protein